MCGTGADIFYPEPEPKKINLEPEPGKNGSASQHCFELSVYLFELHPYRYLFELLVYVYIV